MINETTKEVTMNIFTTFTHYQPKCARTETFVIVACQLTLGHESAQTA